MAALSITAANVLNSNAGSNESKVQAGEALTIGVPVYLDTATGRYKKADADAAATAIVAGITLTEAAANLQPLVIQTGGQLAFGAILTVGTQYCAGTTAGEIVPFADLVTGDFPNFLGTASTTSVLDLEFYDSGIALPA